MKFMNLEYTKIRDRHTFNDVLWCELYGFETVFKTYERRVS